MTQTIYTIACIKNIIFMCTTMNVTTNFHDYKKLATVFYILFLLLLAMYNIVKCVEEK